MIEDRRALIVEKDRMRTMGRGHGGLEDAELFNHPVGLGS